MTIKRPIPKVYDYLGNKKSEIHSAYGIVEDGEYGNVPELSFKVPYYVIDGNGNTVYDAEGQKIIDPRIYTLQNEYLVEFNSDFYIIKYVEDGRTNDNQKFVSVRCVGKSNDLAYKQIPYLNLSPPINPPVDAKRGMLEVITYPYQVELGYGYFTSVSGANVTLPTTVGSFDYTGYKIVTLDGAGKYQQRKINSYNTSTRVATLESAFSPVANTTTLFRIHNSKYDLGTVDPLLINDGTSNIFRALKFEDITILDALNTLAIRFVGNLEYVTTFNTTYNEYRTAVNLSLPNDYDNYEFRYRKNIKGVRRVVDSTNGCYTRVYPEGRNNLSIASVLTTLRTDPKPIGSETYAEHTQGRGDLYNFKYYLAQGYTIDQCRDLFIKDFRFIEDAYTDADMLYDGARRALEELAIPKITYEIDVVDLGIVFADINPLILKRGDTIRVVDNDLGFNFFATVTSVRRDWDKPYSPYITLSNFVDNLGDIYYKILKYNEAYSSRKSLYGKNVSAIIADQLTSRNWRYADYIVPMDGSKTADEVIQAVIDEVSESGGGDIVLHAGDFIFYDTVTLKDNTTIIGNGSGTNIICGTDGITGFDCDESSGQISSVEVKNVSFKPMYNEAGTSVIARFSQHALLVADNVQVTNCTFTSPSSLCVQFGNSNNVKLNSNIFDLDFTTQNTIFIVGGDNIEVRNNTFRETDVSQLLIFASLNNNGEVYIEDNYIITDSSPVSSILFGKIFVDSAVDSSVSIRGNTIISTADIGDYSAIRVGRGKYVEVVNNTIDGGFEYGVNVDGIFGVYDSSVLVDSNIINIGKASGSSTAGIFIDDYNDVSVQNNIIRRTSKLEPTLTNLDYGILIGSGASRTFVSNNNLYNSGSIASLQDNGSASIIPAGMNKL